MTKMDAKSKKTKGIPLSDILHFWESRKNNDSIAKCMVKHANRMIKHQTSHKDRLICLDNNIQSFSSIPHLSLKMRFGNWFLIASLGRIEK